MNVTDDPGDFIREIDKVRAALKSIEGKPISVRCTKAQYDEIMAKRQRDVVDLRRPDASRRMSLKDSMSNIRRRFGDAIKKLGEM